MFAKTNAYSGIAVKDLQDARKFYRGILGLPTSEEDGLMWLHLASGRDMLVYQQRNATPASYTVLNFEVADIDAAVDALAARGVRFERYEGIEQDDKGVFREQSLHRVVRGPVRERPVGCPGEVVQKHRSDRRTKGAH